MSGQPDPLAAVQGAIRASGLIEPGAGVLAMVSGGPDSVCMLHALATVHGPQRLAALHLDHGLRPEAAEDERHCRELCERLGLDLEVERLELDAGAPGNLHDRARAARYAAARRAAAERGLDLIATAHTASDQAETVLYRLAASPGRRALLGIPARSGEVVRPLLRVPGEATRAYCRAAGLAWREDPSNADRRFARARVRHEALPALRRVHPAAERNLLATRDLLVDEAEVLDAAVEEALRAAGAAGPGSRAVIEGARLAEQPPALRRLMVRALAERAAGRAVALPAELADAVAGLPAGSGSRTLDLGGGLRAVSEYGVLRFAVAAGEGPEPAPALLEVPGSCRFGEWTLSAELAPGGPPPGGPDEAHLDRARLHAPLRVRAWAPGDRMEPLGLGGTKSLQDVFTDRRVPRAMRARLPVVESGGEIAWVAGVAVSERFRLPPEGGEAVRLTAKHAA